MLVQFLCLCYPEARINKKAGSYFQIKGDKIVRLKYLKMCTKRTIVHHLPVQHFCLAEILFAGKHSISIKSFEYDTHYY